MLGGQSQFPLITIEHVRKLTCMNIEYDLLQKDFFHAADVIES